MRVLEIAHDHPAWTPGGTEIVSHDLTRALDARPGVTARFLAAATSLQRPGAAPGTLQALGADFVLCTGAYDRFSMVRRDGNVWIDSLARLLGTVQPDIMHLHGLDRIGAEVIPVLRRLSPRSRIVLSLHDYQLICPNDGLLLRTHDGGRCEGAQPDSCGRCFPAIGAARHAMRRAHLMALVDPVDAFIAPSAFLRDQFVEWGLPAGRIQLIRNAIVAPRRAAPRALRDTARNRFAYFGNIARHKGVLVLLDAAARLRQAGTDLRIDLYGGLGWADDGFRGAFATGLAAAHPLVQHLGPYAPGEAVGLMQATDWVVLPSIWWENSPLTILEARAAGRPVICSGIGGMAGLVTHGLDGLHVPPGDAAALAETLVAAAADPQLWSRLVPAEPAPDSHDRFVDAHLELFSQLLERVPT